MDPHRWQTQKSLLSTLSNMEIVKGTGWKELTEVTKDCRLIYRMFDMARPKDSSRELAGTNRGVGITR